MKTLVLFIILSITACTKESTAPSSLVGNWTFKAQYVGADFTIENINNHLTVTKGVVSVATVPTTNGMFETFNLSVPYMMPDDNRTIVIYEYTQAQPYQMVISIKAIAGDYSTMTTDVISVFTQTGLDWTITQPVVISRK